MAAGPATGLSEAKAYKSLLNGVPANERTSPSDVSTSILSLLTVPSGRDAPECSTFARASAGSR